MEAESKNITVEYDIQCTEVRIKLPMYKLVELVGNLLNNAMDALRNHDDKRMYISLLVEQEYLHIEVRNICEELTTEQIAAMFRRGYSNKGEGRGLGLYSLKKMGKEYGFQIVCSNLQIEGKNWISFCVQLEKST